jgi:TIR domain
MRIRVLDTPDDGGDYLNVCGIDGEIDPATGEQAHWNISFSTWEEWLGMTIEAETLAEFSCADIVAACIYEMSWDGGSQHQIRAKRREESHTPLVFISHASEDKQDVARPLAEELMNLGLEVWFDEYELKVGDSLRASVADAISRTDCGVVILSKAFFRKKWTDRELAGLVSIEMSRHGSILPIWHGVTSSEVAGYDPSLADKFALSTASLSIGAIALKVEEAVSIKRRVNKDDDNE